MSFQAKLATALLKKVVAAIKDLVEDVSLECTPGEGVFVQAMDTSHVCLVSVHLRLAAFREYACPKSMTMSVKLET